MVAPCGCSQAGQSARSREPLGRRASLAAMEPFTDHGALLVDTYGLKLLCYVTASDEADLTQSLSGARQLPEPKENVLGPLAQIARQAAASAAGPKAAPVRFHLDVLGRFQASLGTSLGTALRAQAGGDIAIDVPDDPLTRALVPMLRDIFPLMLLPDDPWMPGHVHLGGSTFRHPQREEFERGVAADPDLATLFPQRVSAPEGSPPLIYRSTGAGGTTQLELLAEVLLGAAWTRARLANRETLGGVAAELDGVVATLRRAARREEVGVPVLIGLTGLLPEGIDRVDLPYGVLRPVAPHERSLAPGAIEGHLSHTVADGDTVVVSYSGDLLLETSVPYRLHLVEPSQDAMPDWPRHLRGFEDVESAVDTTRLAVLLAGSGDVPLNIVPTWRLMLDPLSWGPMVGWTDPRTLPGLTPRRLTKDIANAIAKLAAAISQQRRPDFEVAIRRTISGMASRGDPSDALVDLVIGWENLFGANQELSFRISASIGWILGADAAERRSIQTLCANIYSDRSKIVHGVALPPARIHRSLTDARGITLRLLRALFTSRRDVLALTSGDSRSKAAIMGGSAED